MVATAEQCGDVVDLIGQLGRISRGFTDAERSQVARLAACIAKLQDARWDQLICIA